MGWGEGGKFSHTPWLLSRRYYEASMASLLQFNYFDRRVRANRKERCWVFQVWEEILICNAPTNGENEFNTWVPSLKWCALVENLLFCQRRRVIFASFLRNALFFALFKRKKNFPPFLEAKNFVPIFKGKKTFFVEKMKKKK